MTDEDVAKQLDDAANLIVELRREKDGIVEMLAQVLNEVGEPVVVSKSGLKDGLPGIGINIDEHPDSFVFSLVKRSE